MRIGDTNLYGLSRQAYGGAGDDLEYDDLGDVILDQAVDVPASIRLVQVEVGSSVTSTIC